MNPTPVRDISVGIFVLIGLAAFAYLSVSLGGLTYRGPSGLTLYASFDEIGGLRARAPVVVGGVKVGQIEGVELDEDLRPRVRMNVDPKLRLPDDSSASILTEGMLGAKYIALEPGGSDVLLGDGDEVPYTQGAVILERMIGRLIDNIGGDSE